MSELTWIIDPATGKMVVHGLTRQEAAALVGDLLPAAREVGCAGPLEVLPVALAGPTGLSRGPALRVIGYWHGSLIEGPGRRSVVKLAGCPIRCPGCLTPNSWDPLGGVAVLARHVADLLLDPAHSRDGVSIVGGEPFLQPDGLLALVRSLRTGGCLSILIYSGYTYESLLNNAEHSPEIVAVLEAIDVLIDGPYVEALVDSAGPWTGSGNQRVIDLPATRRAGTIVTIPANW